MTQFYQQFVENLDKWLHSSGRISDIADKIERSTGVKRVYIAQGLYSLQVIQFKVHYLN